MAGTRAGEFILMKVGAGGGGAGVRQGGMWHKPPTVPEEHLGTSVCVARPHLPESGEGYRSRADPECLGSSGSVQGWGGRTFKD